MPGMLWTFVAPMLFYCAWQLSYFIVVQVGCLPNCSATVSLQHRLQLALYSTEYCMCFLRLSVKWLMF